jgi:hypothetical protein
MSGLLMLGDLSDERTSLLFTIAAGLRQYSICCIYMDYVILFIYVAIVLLFSYVSIYCFCLDLVVNSNCLKREREQRP